MLDDIPWYEQQIGCAGVRVTLFSDLFKSPFVRRAEKKNTKSLLPLYICNRVHMHYLSMGSDSVIVEGGAAGSPGRPITDIGPPFTRVRFGTSKISGLCIIYIYYSLRARYE